MTHQETAVESCRQAQIRIREVQRLLLDPRPQTLDLCEAELSRIAAVLKELVSSDSSAWGPGMLASLQQVQRGARRLGQQIEHASNFCLGWIQLSFGTGYTRQGRPVFANREAGTSFEA